MPKAQSNKMIAGIVSYQQVCAINQSRDQIRLRKCDIWIYLTQLTDSGVVKLQPSGDISTYH